jgi:hypothetical protein
MKSNKKKTGDKIIEKKEQKQKHTPKIGIPDPYHTPQRDQNRPNIRHRKLKG